MTFIEWPFHFAARHRWTTLTVVLLLSAIATFGLLRLKIDTSYESLISAERADWPAYQRVVREFGSDNVTVIFLRDPQMWKRDHLLLAQQLSNALEDLPSVAEVESPFTVQSVSNQDGMLESGPLLDYVPKRQADIDAIRAAALRNPLIRGNLVSADGKALAINLTLRAAANHTEANRVTYAEIERLLQPLRAHFQQVFQVGSPRLDHELEKGLISDMSFLTPLSIALLIVVIILFLRTPLAAVLPVLTAGFAVLWTFGFMGYVGIPLSLLTAIVPSLVVVIGSTEDTHLLATYLEGLHKGESRDRQRVVHWMIRQVALAVTINGITTVLGFGSNAMSDTPLIRDFAIASSFSLLADMVSTMLLVPMVLAWAGPLHSRLPAPDSEPRGLSTWIATRLDLLGQGYTRPVVVVTLAVLAVFAYQASKVTVTNDPLSYFHQSHPLAKDARTLHEELSGIQYFFITLESHRANTFRSPDGLKLLQDVTGMVEAQKAYDSVLSLSEEIALVNREMKGGDPKAFKVPDDAKVIDEYLLMFRRSDLQRFVDSDFRQVNIVVRHNISDSHTLNIFLRQLREQLRARLPADISYRITGRDLMINEAAESLFSSQIYALGMLVAIIFLIMSVMFTSMIAGLLSLIPNLIPVILNFGVMGWLGIPLNPGTATVAAIAVGLAVDDTVHLMSHYARECRELGDQTQAASRTIRTEALPVISTSISLTVGFAILGLSDFAIVAEFGYLAAATMIYALISDLLITPMILRHTRLVGVWEIISLKLDPGVVLHSPLFKGMTPYEIRKSILLSRLARYDPGQAIIEQGSHSSDMYVLLEGQVGVETGDGAPLTLGPGEIFGEVAFAGHVERTATVRALRPSSVMVLGLESTRRSLRWYPRIASRLYENISTMLCQRFARSSEHPVSSLSNVR